MRPHKLLKTVFCSFGYKLLSFITSVKSLPSSDSQLTEDPDVISWQHLLFHLNRAKAAEFSLVTLALLCFFVSLLFCFCLFVLNRFIIWEK